MRRIAAVLAASLLLPFVFAAGTLASQGLAALAHGSESGRVKSGTGFYVSPTGFLLTTRHVVAACPGISVWPEGGGGHDAQLVASDAGLDLALLSVKGRTPGYAVLRQRDNLKPGQSVLTIAFGVLPTEPRKPLLTWGTFVKSGLMPPRERVLFVRARLHPGNSGGPVIDPSGDLVGMVIGRLADHSDLGVIITGREINGFLSRVGIRPVAQEGEGSRPQNPNEVASRIAALVQCSGGAE